MRTSWSSISGVWVVRESRAISKCIIRHMYLVWLVRTDWMCWMVYLFIISFLMVGGV